MIVFFILNSGFDDDKCKCQFLFEASPEWLCSIELQKRKKRMDKLRFFEIIYIKFQADTLEYLPEW